MTEETWNITVGDRDFILPRLPLRVTRVVYPICQKLTNNDLPQRILDPSPDKKFIMSDEEVDDLVKIAFLACQVGGGDDLTQESFGALPITPPQLCDAFFAIRYACGGWVKITRMEDQEPEGEELRLKFPT